MSRSEGESGGGRGTQGKKKVATAQSGGGCLDKTCEWRTHLLKMKQHPEKAASHTSGEPAESDRDSWTESGELCWRWRGDPPSRSGERRFCDSTAECWPESPPGMARYKRPAAARAAIWQSILASAMLNYPAGKTPLEECTPLQTRVTGALEREQHRAER